MSDNTLPMSSEYVGASDSQPAIVKFTKTFKMFTTV